MNIIKALSIVLGLSLAVPAQATIVTVDGTYTFDGLATHNFVFAADTPGLLTIANISFDLGAGLQYDLEAGAAGFDPLSAAYVPTFFATVGSTDTAPVSGSHAPISFSFTGFDSGESFFFQADVDTTTADATLPADFETGGRMSALITFAPTAGNSIVGPNQVAFFGTNPGWMAGVSSSSYEFAGTFDVAAIPEARAWLTLAVVTMGVFGIRSIKAWRLRWANAQRRLLWVRLAFRAQFWPHSPSRVQPRP